MRPTLVRLVRIIPRSQLVGDSASSKPIRPLPGPVRSDVKKPTLIELLQERSKAADFPANIRIEPVVPRNAFRDVAPEVRSELKELLKER
ncbi:hypothetical protein C8Q75DRAFT_739815 [Abortiporus biennis]|nr:hypothetical protein C8Q75DRAFT_739815 [Abortiporus biennis]